MGNWRGRVRPFFCFMYYLKKIRVELKCFLNTEEMKTLEKRINESHIKMLYNEQMVLQYELVKMRELSWKRAYFIFLVECLLIKISNVESKTHKAFKGSWYRINVPVVTFGGYQNN